MLQGTALYNFLSSRNLVFAVISEVYLWRSRTIFFHLIRQWKGHGKPAVVFSAERTREHNISYYYCIGNIASRSILNHNTYTRRCFIALRCQTCFQLYLFRTAFGRHAFSGTNHTRYHQRSVGRRPTFKLVSRRVRYYFFFLSRAPKVLLYKSGRRHRKKLVPVRSVRASNVGWFGTPSVIQYTHIHWCVKHIMFDRFINSCDRVRIGTLCMKELRFLAKKRGILRCARVVYNNSFVCRCRP